MSKAEELLGIKYTELNPQQKKIYQNILKKESRKRNLESIKENNKKYYEKQKQIIIELKQQLAEKDKVIEKLNRYLQLEWALTPARCDGKTFTKLNVIQDFIHITRKQVCDEIGDFINKYDALEPKKLFVMDLLVKLDQIKKGE